MTDSLPLGQRLRAAREKKGASRSEAAEATRMKVQMIEEIEGNDFSHIPATVYGKGFIRMYAEYLGLDPVPLIQEYSEHYAVVMRPSLKTSGGGHPSPNRLPVQGEIVAPVFDWSRIRRELKDAFLRPVELALLALDRVSVPSLKGRRSLRTAAAVRIPRRPLPVWQIAAVAVGALIVLVFVVSGISRFVKRPGHPAEAAGPTSAHALRLAEEPPPPYLPVSSP
jgi:transcriptional regulator with XRE-family HTH domain